MAALLQLLIDATALYALTVGLLIVVTVIDGEHWVEW